MRRSSFTVDVCQIIKPSKLENEEHDVKTFQGKELIVDVPKMLSFLVCILQGGDASD